MTTEEFKARCPDKAHYTGDRLWNAMEKYMLKHPELKESSNLVPKGSPLESHRMVFIDTSEYDGEGNIQRGKGKDYLTVDATEFAAVDLGMYNLKDRNTTVKAGDSVIINDPTRPTLWRLKFRVMEIKGEEARLLQYEEDMNITAKSHSRWELTDLLLKIG